MLSALTATLHITEQKNSFKGVCVHHGALEGNIFACPVKTLSRRVAHIQVHISNGTTLCVNNGTVLAGEMSLIGI